MNGTEYRPNDAPSICGPPDNRRREIDFSFRRAQKRDRLVQFQTSLNDDVAQASNSLESSVVDPEVFEDVAEQAYDRPPENLQYGADHISTGSSSGSGQGSPGSR